MKTLEQNLATEFTNLVNSFTFDPKKHAEETMRNNPECIPVFSALAAAWLKHLGTMDPRWIDMRNESAWEMACTLKDVLADEDLQTYKDHANNIDLEKFGEEMSCKHKTLQQSFTRLCREWFLLLAGYTKVCRQNVRWIALAVQMKSVLEAAVLPFI